MSVVYDVSVAVLASGTAAVVAAGIGAVVARDSLQRLHLAAVMTSLGGPLIGAGLCLQQGSGLTRASVLLPIGLLAISGPALSSAVGRMLAQRRGAVDPGESPQ